MLSTSSIKNLQKTEKCFFQTLITLLFGLQVAQNDFLISLLWPKSDLNSPERFASLSQKIISTLSLKNLQKLENGFFKGSEHSFLSSRLLKKHFLRRFLWSNFDLNKLQHFASFSQKRVSTSSLKYLQKTCKSFFHTLRIFVFELKVSPKPFSKKVPMTKFWFK